MNQIGSTPTASNAVPSPSDHTANAAQDKAKTADKAADSKWNTTTLNLGKIKKEIRDIADVLATDKYPVSIKDYLAKTANIQEKLGVNVPRYSKLLIEAEAVLNQMLAQSGRSDLKPIKLEIERNPQINAYVLHSEELEHTRLTINTGILQALEEKFGKLTSSHLAFIIGHELGHIVEGHYQELSKDKYPTQNGERIELNLKKIGEEHLKQRAFGRDQEKRVDQHALRWMAQAGYKIEDGLQVLELLASLSKNQKANQKIDIAYLAKKMTDTHPGSSLRLNEARGVCKEIQNEGLVTAEVKDTKHKHIELAKDLVLTPAQKTLKELQDIIKGADPKNYPWDKISNLLEQTTTSQETGQLVTWLPFFYRAACNAVPFEANGAYNPENRDKKNIYEATEQAKEFEKAYEAILDKHQDLIEAELTGKDSLEIKFAKYIQSRALYEGSVELIDEFMDSLKKDPCKALTLIDQYGLVAVDCKALGKDFYDICQRLVEDSNEIVARRGELFLELNQHDGLDIRAGMFKLLLQEGLLDGIKDPQQLKEFIVTAEKLFGNNVDLWLNAGIEKDLSYAVADWTKKRCTDKSGKFDFELHQAICEQIFSRQSPIVRTESERQSQADWIYVMTAATRFDFDKDVAAQVQWVISRPNLEPGVTRDMLLLRLVESLTGVFAKVVHPILLELTNSSSADVKVVIDEAYVKESNLKDFELIFSHLNIEWVKGRNFLVDSARIASNAPKLDSNDHPIKTFEHFIPIKYEHIRSRALLSFIDSEAIHSEANQFGPESNLKFYLQSYARYIENIIILSDPTRRDEQVIKIVSDFAMKYAVLTLLLGIEIALPDNKSDEFSKNFINKLNTALLNQFIYLFIKNFQADKAKEYKQKFASNIIGESQFIDHLRDHSRLASFSNIISNPILSKESGLITDLLYLRCLAEFADLIAYRIIERRSKDIPQVEYYKDSFPKYADIQTLYPKIKALFAKVKLSADDSLVSNFELGGATRFAEKLADLKEIYTDYKNYLRYDTTRSERETKNRASNLEVQTLSIHEACNLCSDLYFNIYFVETWPKEYAAMSPQEKIDEITALYILPSEARDLRISQAIENIIDDPSFLKSDLALKAYQLLRSPLLKNDLGRKIYTARFSAEVHLANFDQHLELILATHPEGLSREAKLKELFDGNAKVKAQVKTWTERDLALGEIAKNQKASTNQDHLIRQTSLELIREAMHDQRLGVGSREKVDIVLWMAGIKDKPHLVRCVELVENRTFDEFRKESGKLSDNEKQQLLKDILAGPGGILTDENKESKRHFYDALFYSVFAGKNTQEQIAANDLKYLKAVFDTLLLYESPERAAEFLANFLVAKIEDKSFGDQVKILFEARGFVGIKIAQYLVSNTTLLPESIKKPLEDLTSRVQGPDKRIVFDMLERIHGPQIRDFVVEIGDRIGGGSLMSFYDVKVKNKDGTIKEGVIGLLRPDIIAAMPEDLNQVYKAIETMQACPQIFGGKVVGMDMMETLLWQSVNETNLERTRELQNKMRGHMQEFMKSHPGSLSLDMPEVWLKGKVGDNTFDLNKGPLIFMDKAQGQTFDRFMPTASKDEITQVKTQIASLALEQILKFGLVHTDLHQGNIMVFKDADKKIKVTLLDVGLSTELPKELQESLKKLIQLFASNIKEEEQGFFKKWLDKFSGSSLDSTKAQELCLQIIESFELLGGHTWGTAAKKAACQKIVHTLSEKELTLSAKITKVMEVTRDLNLVFPREFYGVLRSLGIMDYIWKDVDRKGLENSMRVLLTSNEPAEKLKKFDAAKLAKQVYNISQELNLKVTQKSIKAVFDAANKEDLALERFKVIYQGFRKLVLDDRTEIGPDAAKQLLTKILANPQLKAEISIDQVETALRQFQERAEKERNELYDNSFFKAEALGETVARENAIDNRLGMLPLVFKAPLYAGTPIRVKTTGNAEQIYISIASNMLVFEHPENLPLVEIDEVSLDIDETESLPLRKLLSSNLKKNKSQSKTGNEFDDVVLSKYNGLKMSQNKTGSEFGDGVFSKDDQLEILSATEKMWSRLTINNLLENPDIKSIEVPTRDANGKWIWVDFFEQACFGRGESESQYFERTREAQASAS